MKNMQLLIASDKRLYAKNSSFIKICTFKKISKLSLFALKNFESKDKWLIMGTLEKKRTSCTVKIIVLPNYKTISQIIEFLKHMKINYVNWYMQVIYIYI